MRKLTRILTLALCAALLLTGIGCAEEGQGRVFRLGTSGYAMVIPAGMKEFEIPAEDAAAGLVALLLEESTSLSIDVYQAGKDGIDDLAAYVEREAKARGGTDVILSRDVGGKRYGSYFLTQTYEGIDYSSVVLVLEDDDGIVEMGLTMGTGEAWELASAIIDSLTYTGK